MGIKMATYPLNKDQATRLKELDTEGKAVQKEIEKELAPLRLKMDAVMAKKEELYRKLFEELEIEGTPDSAAIQDLDSEDPIMAVVFMEEDEETKEE